MFSWINVVLSIWGYNQEKILSDFMAFLMFLWFPNEPSFGKGGKEAREKGRISVLLASGWKCFISLEQRFQGFPLNK